MNYLPATPQDYEAIRQFLAGEGWQHRVTDAEKFRALLDNSDRAVVAWDGDRVVGFARALCDGVSNGYVSMVAVAADRRREGIGRALVHHLIRDDSGITWVLRAGRGSEAFWRRLGFAPSTLAMERAREQDAPPG